jgi:hypothetical protein
MNDKESKDYYYYLSKSAVEEEESDEVHVLTIFGVDLTDCQTFVFNFLYIHCPTPIAV